MQWQICHSCQCGFVKSVHNQGNKAIPVTLSLPSATSQLRRPPGFCSQTQGGSHALERSHHLLALQATAKVEPDAGHEEMTE